MCLYLVTEVRTIQQDLLAMYEADFGKHIEPRELPRVRITWNAIPVQLAKENRKFFFGQVKKGARAKEFEMAAQWLIDCGLIAWVYRVAKPASRSRHIWKRMPISCSSWISACSVQAVNSTHAHSWKGIASSSSSRGH